MASIGVAPTSTRASRYSLCSSLVRSCDRSAILSCGSAFFRVPPGRLARLHGRLSWVLWPPSLHAFSAQRAGTFAGRRRNARGVTSMRWPPSDVSSRGDCLPTVMGACAPPLLRFCCTRPTVACARRSRVCFAVGGRVLLRSREPLTRSLVRRRTARRRSPYRGRDSEASGSQLVHSSRRVRSHFRVARLDGDRRAPLDFHTAIHSLWRERAAPSDVADSRRHARARPRPTPLSAIQHGSLPPRAPWRDRHRLGARPAPICAIEVCQAAFGALAPRRWTPMAIGLIVPSCRSPSTRSCKAPR